MGRFDIKLLGDTELEKTLAGLTDRLERKVLASAFRQAATGVLRAAQQNISAPRTKLFPGQRGNKRREREARRFTLKHIARLRNHLHVVALKRKTGRVGYRVITGTRAELGIDAADRYYYPAHVEKGHAAPGHGRARANARALTQRELGSRRTPPHPFLRPALKSRELEVLNQLQASIRAGIARENLRQG
jgi:hypothetical protein